MVKLISYVTGDLFTFCCVHIPIVLATSTSHATLFVMLVLNLMSKHLVGLFPLYEIVVLLHVHGSCCFHIFTVLVRLNPISAMGPIVALPESTSKAIFIAFIANFPKMHRVLVLMFISVLSQSL